MKKAASLYALAFVCSCLLVGCTSSGKPAATEDPWLPPENGYADDYEDPWFHAPFYAEVNYIWGVNYDILPQLRNEYIIKLNDYNSYYTLSNYTC